MKHISRRVWISLIVSLALIVASLVFLASEANAQDDIAALLKSELAQRGVPVKSVEIASRVPFRLEIKLQSNSRGQSAQPEDALFEQAVQRQVALARARNVPLDAVRVTVLNTDGAPIFWSDVPVSGIQAVRGAGLDNNTTARLVREQIAPKGMMLKDINVSGQEGGGQSVTIQLSVPAIEAANVALPDFMTNLPASLMRLNKERGTQIVIVKVQLTTDAGETLLNYSYDFQLEKETWWQAEGLTRDWFPNPPPPSSH